MFLTNGCGCSDTAEARVIFFVVAYGPENLWQFSCILAALKTKHDWHIWSELVSDRCHFHSLQHVMHWWNKLKRHLSLFVQQSAVSVNCYLVRITNQLVKARDVSYIANTQWKCCLAYASALYSYLFGAMF